MIGSLLLTGGTRLVWAKESRSVFAGTDEVNLEAKCVTLDVRGADHRGEGAGWTRRAAALIAPRSMSFGAGRACCHN
jgi:hypothetical protein